jgi:hypothetical protein
MAGGLEHPEFYRWFATDEVESADDSPGIYAWYPVPQIGKPDYEQKDAFRSLLDSFSTRFIAPSLSVRASTTFLLRWEGSIQETTSARFRDLLQGPDDKVSKSMQKIVDKERNREVLARLLTLTIPILASPLYIGMSENLRTRLAQHRDELYDRLSQAREDPEYLQRSRLDQTFASRAIASGFSGDTLVVWTINLEKALGLSSAEDDAKEVAAGTEWLLNRWFRPIFGRR